MVILSKNYSGLVAYCDRCKALLGWTSADVYGTVIYCPICKNQIEVPLIKENKENGNNN